MKIHRIHNDVVTIQRNETNSIAAAKVEKTKKKTNGTTPTNKKKAGTKESQAPVQ